MCTRWREEKLSLRTRWIGVEKLSMEERHFAEAFKAGNIVVDAFVDTFSVLNVRRRLRNHKSYIGCRMDPVFVVEAQSPLILICPGQLLCWLKINEYENTRCFVKIVVCEVKGIEWKGVWIPEKSEKHNLSCGLYRYISCRTLVGTSRRRTFLR